MVLEMEMKMVDINGTCLQGYIVATYKDLVSILGEPNGISDGYKVDSEWRGVVKNIVGEEVFTIYNYKTGKNYLGDEGLDLEYITDWHIGGYKQWVGHIVQHLIHEKLGELKRVTNS